MYVYPVICSLEMSVKHFIILLLVVMVPVSIV